MPSRPELSKYYDLVRCLGPAVHDAQRAPYEVSHDNYRTLMRTPHDVGGELDTPEAYEEKEEEQWELDTYVTCEVLAWRGAWNAEERRRRGNNDVGQALYLSFPYYGRWILCAARMLVDKNHVSLSELMDKIQEVETRHGKH